MNRKLKSSMTRERFPLLVGAVFRRRDEANDAAYNLQLKLGLSPAQISIIPPGDKNFERKIEPESANIGRTLAYSHIHFGLFGGVAGFVLALVLTLIGPVAIQSSPGLTMVAFTSIGLILGLLFAGLVSLRPDHDPLINKVRHAVKHNSWTIIVRTASENQKANAKKLLEARTSETLASI